MRQKSEKATSTALFGLLGIASLFCLGLLAAPKAHAAAMEQVCTFAGSAAPVAEEKFAEEVQLGGVGGMAVNYTGNGGVPKGTVYAATKVGGNFRIAMFTPKAGGCLEFEVSWEVPTEAGPYERCGPALAVKCQVGAMAGPAFIDVEVDQATGNVYALNGEIQTAGRKMVVEYDAEGTEEITRFGEKAATGKTAETPTQIHEADRGGLAINAAGEVYVFDINGSDKEYHRLMVFKPQTPGDFENYVYAGDVAAGFNADGRIPFRPVADAAGNIYVAGDGYIEMYAPEAPAPFPAPPAEVVCSFEHEPGGIRSITVNPESGEVFFFSLKKEAGFQFKLVHQLAPCDEAKEVFEEIGKFEVKPERDDLWALAFDPEREFSPTRPAGMLYGGAPRPEPDSGGPGEPGQSSLGYGFAPAEEKPPTVLSESITKVGAKSAQLWASIDPEGFPTNYVFEYLTEAAFEAGGEDFEDAVKAPPAGAPIPGTVGAQPVAVTISGLLPDIEYRFRVVASSECAPGEPGKVCEAGGAGRRFRTYPPGAQVLPDGRGYELVSPAQKHGGQVFPADSSFDSCGPIECKPGFDGHQPYPLQSTADGNAIAYEGTSFGPSEGTALENEYIARRTESGWQNTNPTPDLLQPGSGYRAFDSSLQVGVLVQPLPVLSPEAPSETANLYSQPSANPLALTPLVSAAPPNRGPGQAFEIVYRGASADLSRVFFSANDALTAANPPFAPAPPDPGPGGSQLYEWSGGQLRLVNVSPDNSTVIAGASFGAGGANAISADGSRAFWVDGSGQTYVRIDGEQTLEIPGGKFLVADTDGSKVLLDDGTLYDLEAKTSVDLTEGAGGFEGVVGQSNDLSRIYFVDTAVLTEEENGEGAKAQADEFNLYAWEAGSPIRFVATLQPRDNKNQTSGGGVVDWDPVPAFRTAQASPDGRYLAFVSRAPLATPIPGYSNIGPCEEDSGTNEFFQVPCPEVFLYDSAANELTCASCAPSGAEPLGWSVLRRIEGAPPSMRQSRYLSNSGRLFFDSQDALSPFDTNEGIEDVYQYEPEGIGGCVREGGCVDLISAGRGGVDSNFLAADETGDNVFFTTRDRLLAADSDELMDLYDARVGGGPPPVSEPSPPEAPLQPPPLEPTPASPTLSDPGNAGPSKPCKKGQVKKKGKCVKKHKGKGKKGKGKKGKGKKSKRGASR